MYLHADMRLKEKALARTEPLGIKPARYRPDDQLLAFLEGALIMPTVDAPREPVSTTESA